MTFNQRVSQSSQSVKTGQSTIQSSRFLDHNKPQLIQTTMKDFIVEKKIGDGAYSQVFHVVRKSDNKDYAIKQVKISRLSDKEKQNALNEVRILASIEDRNIIAYKEAFFDESSSTLCVVMEYADGGDLYNKIVHHKKMQTYFSEREIWDCLIQMTRGLQALHEKSILHRDLKSANVFMELDGNIKLGDLNVSKVCQKDGLLLTQTGTPYYASPEVWKDQPYDNKSDIWSLGCVLYEMTTLNPPFTASNMDKLFQAVLSGSYQPIPQNYSKSLERTLKQLLQVNPNKRPSCEQILNMTIVQDFLNKNKDLDQYQTAPSHRWADDYSNNCFNGGDEMLKTIHMPQYLSQLQTVLPKSKYEPEIVESRQYRDRQSIISMAQQIVLPPIREFDSLQRKGVVQSIDPNAIQTQNSNYDFEQPQIIKRENKNRNTIRKLKKKQPYHTSSIDLTKSQSHSTRSSVVQTNKSKQHDKLLTKYLEDEVIIKDGNQGQSHLRNFKAKNQQLMSVQQSRTTINSQIQQNTDSNVLNGLLESLQAIRSAKDLINQQVRIHQKQNIQPIPRTNSVLAHNGNLEVIQEKFVPQHASVGSLIQQRQASTTRNQVTQSQQIESTVINSDELQIKEAKQNILKYLPIFESSRDYETKEKSKIIVDLSSCSQLVINKQKPPISQIDKSLAQPSPKKVKNISTKDVGLCTQNAKVSSPSVMRHSESQKVVTGVDGQNQRTGSSSRLLPQIRPYQEEIRQNSSSVLQYQKNNDHLEQLRFFVALRQQKKQRQNYQSIQSRQPFDQSSGSKKQTKQQQKSLDHSSSVI